MKRNLFERIFRLTIALVLVSFLVLGLTLSVFSGRFWMREKYQLLSDNAQALSLQIGQARDLNSAMRPSYIRGMADMTANALGGLVVITTADGTVYYPVTEPAGGDAPRVREDILRAVQKQNYQAMSTLGGLLSEECYVAGAPIVQSDVFQGAVFVAAPAGGMRDYILKVICIFCICSSFIIILVCIGVYMLTTSMVRPLRAMSEAAKCMASGDFSRRIVTDRQDEIGELANSFNNMTHAIESAERSRRGFAANVSHELRTPMTIISGFIDGILDGTIPKAEQEKYLRIISAEIHRLSRMVTTMLNLSKLEEGSIKPNFRELNLTEIIVGVVLSFESRIEEKKLEIRGLDTLKRVVLQADSDLMYQAVFNLVENAIKFTQEGGYISFAYRTETPGQIRVLIRNSGEGIASDSLPYIFDRFYKTDKSRSGDKTGVGLGLNLVKTIVSLHNGSITVRSIPGEYCEFEVILNLTEGNSELK